MQTEKRKYDSNMWGWKWSLISLVIILLAAFILFVVKPNEGYEGIFSGEKELVDSLVSEE